VLHTDEIRHLARGTTADADGIIQRFRLEVKGVSMKDAAGGRSTSYSMAAN